MPGTDAILALAPDPQAAKAGQALADARKWRLLAADGQAVWGECQGSGADPYRTAIDLSGPAFRCTCPSRKFPCKHALGLLLLWQAQPGQFERTPVLEWVSTWLAGRQRRAAAAQEVAAVEAAAPPVPALRADRSRTAARREARVAQGLDDLERWLDDLLRYGLAAAQSRPASFWEAPAARLVDAQAPGLARRLREMPSLAASGEGWQARMLEALARLHLLVQAYRRLDELPPELQSEVRSQVGWTLKQDELVDGPGLADCWVVLGQRVEEENPGALGRSNVLRVQRTWLWGESTKRPALLLHFAAPGRPLETSLLPGTAFEGELVFYPGAFPLRALIKKRGSAEAAAAMPGFSSLLAATGAYAHALAANPWLDRFPLPLTAAWPAFHAGAWAVRDAEGRQIPVAPHFKGGWRLLALSGGHPIGLSGEWNGERYLPLAAFAGGRWTRLE